MEILTPLQKNFLHKFSAGPYQKSFFLTGGTALAAFYLYHRLSEDLDFFTEDQSSFHGILDWIEKTAGEMRLRVEIRRHADSFIDCYFESQDGGEFLKVDFALDAPFRFEKLVLNTEFNVYVDNLTDISCNKLSALFDRAEAKDFVDLYFLDKEFLPFEQILAIAKKKHVGLDDYWLAQALKQVEGIHKLPRMIKPLDLEDFKKGFLAKIQKLIVSPP
jgi:predicted nucleotidyltransferase component of viral defense system